MASFSTFPALPDYHTHNRLCKHADGQPIDYARMAATRGLPALAATDHCPTDDGFGHSHRMPISAFPTYQQWVLDARAASSIPILFGVEADYYRGCERFLAPWLEKHPLDVVLGSVHMLSDGVATPTDARPLNDGSAPDVIWRTYFQLIGELADTGLYDIVAHLDLPKRYAPRISDALLREYALPALDRIARANMAIEINTSGLFHDHGECYPSLPLLAWARERGVGLSFGSDSHSPDRVGTGFDIALQMARDVGYTTSRHYTKRTFTEHPLPMPGPSN